MTRGRPVVLDVGVPEDGTACVPLRSVRKIVSPPDVPRCRTKKSRAGVWKLVVSAAVRSEPTPTAFAIVTVYDVASSSGRVNRTPTLRPEVSTVNGAAGVTVT